MVPMFIMVHQPAGSADSAERMRPCVPVWYKLSGSYLSTPEHSLQRPGCTDATHQQVEFPRADRVPGIAQASVVRDCSTLGKMDHPHKLKPLSDNGNNNLCTVLLL